MTPLDGPAKPLPKAAQLARGDRRYRRTVASPKRWQQIIAAKEGPCRVCEFIRTHPDEAAQMDITLAECEGLPITWHHIVDRGAPHHGSDTEANAAPVGGSGTTGHHGKITGRHKGACAAFRRMMDDAEYAYANERMGEVGFERVYPVRWERP